MIDWATALVGICFTGATFIFLTVMMLLDTKLTDKKFDDVHERIDRLRDR